MAATTYKVVKGDTLWAISQKYNTTVSNLVKLNNIKNPDYIVVGQVLKLSGTPETEPKNTTYKATIKLFGLQSNSNRTIYATWTWDKSYTENYQVKWYYDTGDGVWFVGTDSTVDDKQSLYNAPSNAKKVKFKVKPISKKRKVNNKETTYWTASWSTEKTYAFAEEPPAAPPVPTVSLERDGGTSKLTAKLDNLDYPSSTEIMFQAVKDDKSVFAQKTVSISKSSAVITWRVTDGSEYKVRCRAKKGDLYSEWSDYSGATATPPPNPPKNITHKGTSESSVYITWDPVKFAEEYQIERTKDKYNFIYGSEYVGEDSYLAITVHTVKAENGTSLHVLGLELGFEYFFRIRCRNSYGWTSWSEIFSIKVGTSPTSPTTWSSTTTAIVGESLNLYWIHNSEDASSQIRAELELNIGGKITTHTINNSTDPDEKDKASSYSVDTSIYNEGVSILWRVRTAGITGEYGEWSVQRTVTIYSKPDLHMSVTDSNGDAVEVLSSFPFYISAEAGPQSQSPLTYHLAVLANEGYETTDAVGNVKLVSAGEQVYSKLFDISDPLLVELSANSLTLENNIGYTITCSVTMDSGLTAEDSSEITVAWSDEQYSPNIEISIDEETCSASLRLHCEDEDGEPIPGIVLSAYRRELDGTFTEIVKDVENSSNSFVIDPHPALDYARYRIIAKSTATGSMSYYDVPDYPIGEKAAIIQWDENWTDFETSNEDGTELLIWTGSMVRLPYNVDFSNNYNPDVALVKYIGRKHPVAYYGTQIGETGSLSVVIEKDDIKTLNALRRLSIWNGNVYVREPYGTGYWAQVVVSFGQKHRDLTIPVTIDISRVEGGM